VDGRIIRHALPDLSILDIASKMTKSSPMTVKLIVKADRQKR
jgi:hypothetical protein